jgi:hypothetical protein
MSHDCAHYSHLSLVSNYPFLSLFLPFSIEHQDAIEKDTLAFTILTTAPQFTAREDRPCVIIILKHT